MSRINRGGLREEGPLLIPGNSKIHLATRNPDIGRRRMTVTINLCVCVISFPYFRGISEKFQRIGERVNIKTVLKLNLH
jgi:hypothetical protein